MNRNPPADVRRILTREVGFCCPVPNCGSPYLEWHHFDPPWRVREHHEPSGMIALCSEHHPKADAGAFTVEQLHEFKLNGAKNHREIKGKFDWFRNKLFLVAGSCFYYETLRVLEFRGEPSIWLRRDENGYLLLNIRMLSTSNEPRLFLEDNCWIEKGNPTVFECPPSGKLIHAKYSNGDELRVEFIELPSQIEAEKRYPLATFDLWNARTSHPDMRFQFPITAIEVTNNIAGTRISFSPKRTTMGGITIQGGFFNHCGCAFSI
jgi:hypothetical protein